MTKALTNAATVIIVTAIKSPAAATPENTPESQAKTALQIFPNEWS